jgi:hypothetical protein
MGGNCDDVCVSHGVVGVWTKHIEHESNIEHTEYEFNQYEFDHQHERGQICRHRQQDKERHQNCGERYRKGCQNGR